MIPLYKCKTYLNGGYQISSNQIKELIEGNIKTNWEALVPHKLPDEVFTHLKDLKLEESPMIKIQDFRGILMNLEWLDNYKNALITLKKSNNHFELELYKRHEITINKFFSEIVNKTKDLIEYLQNNFSEFEGNENYITVLNLLETIRNSSCDDLDDIIFLIENRVNIDSLFKNILVLKD